MSLAEVLAAAIVLVCASCGSLRVWALSTAAAASVQQRGTQVLVLDQAVLEAAAALAAGLAPQADCGAAATAMAAQLAALPLPAGVGRQLEPAPDGVWLQLQAGTLPPRQRWFDAAALGACTTATAATPTQPTTLEAGDGTGATAL